LARLTTRFATAGAAVAYLSLNKTVMSLTAGGQKGKRRYIGGTQESRLLVNDEV
jgi:hypothetical protein